MPLARGEKAQKHFVIGYYGLLLHIKTYLRAPAWSHSKRRHRHTRAQLAHPAHRFITSVITSLLPIITKSLLPIITVIMDPLLHIITRSIMGNNGSIITYYPPEQLGDAETILPICPAARPAHEGPNSKCSNIEDVVWSCWDLNSVISTLQIWKYQVSIVKNSEIQKWACQSMHSLSAKQNCTVAAGIFSNLQDSIIQRCV